MTYSGKSSAALRVRSLAELTDSGLSAQGADGATPRENLRQNLHGFPKLVQQLPTPEAQTSLLQLEDLAAELEAALMGDLQNVASLWEPEAPKALAAPVAPASEPPAHHAPQSLSQIALDQVEIDATLAAEMPPSAQARDELPRQDRLAVELLLARGRRPDVAAKPVIAEADPVELEDRLAGELAQRLSIAVDELRFADGEEPTFDAEPSNHDAVRRRVILNRQLLAVVALLAVVGGGALATIHAVASGGQAVVTDELDGVATAGIVKAGAAPLPAPAVKQTYDRASEDQSLPESPQLRGADMLASVPGSAPTVPAVMLPGSAVSTQPVQPSVRAAYAGPDGTAATMPAAVATVPVTEAAPVADDATPAAVAKPEMVAAAPEATLPAAAAVAAPKNLAAGSPAPGLAKITSGVRLRGNPDNGAPTVAMLKAGDHVQVVQCKGWCEVVADGKRGFVFKKFLAELKN